MCFILTAALCGHLHIGGAGWCSTRRVLLGRWGQEVYYEEAALAEIGCDYALFFLLCLRRELEIVARGRGVSRIRLRSRDAPGLWLFSTQGWRQRELGYSAGGVLVLRGDGV